MGAMERATTSNSSGSEGEEDTTKTVSEDGSCHAATSSSPTTEQNSQHQDSSTTTALLEPNEKLLALAASVAARTIPEEAPQPENESVTSYRSLEGALLRSPSTTSRRPPAPLTNTLIADQIQSSSTNNLKTLETRSSSSSVSSSSPVSTTNRNSSRSTKIRSTVPRQKGLRRGKWTAEEETYVARVIQDFNAGFLDAPAGTTLRTYLSEKLKCDPMRITKKFTGEACIGKRVFHPAVRTPSNGEAIDKAQVG